MAVTVDTSKTGIASNIQVLAKSAVAVSGAADTNENILATVTIPAGAMGANGALRLTCFWAVTGSTNAKTLRVRLGGIGGTAYVATAIATAGITAVEMDGNIANRNSQSSQIGWVSAFSSVGSIAQSGSKITSAIDTSAATTLVITGQKALGSETLTLDAYLVELIPGA